MYFISRAEAEQFVQLKLDSEIPDISFLTIIMRFSICIKRGDFVTTIYRWHQRSFQTHVKHQKFQAFSVSERN